jgi:hypothetical protein
MHLGCHLRLQGIWWTLSEVCILCKCIKCLSYWATNQYFPLTLTHEDQKVTWYLCKGRRCLTWVSLVGCREALHNSRTNCNTPKHAHTMQISNCTHMVSCYFIVYSYLLEHKKKKKSGCSQHRKSTSSIPQVSYMVQQHVMVWRFKFSGMWHQIIYQLTSHHTPNDVNLHQQDCENLISQFNGQHAWPPSRCGIKINDTHLPNSIMRSNGALLQMNSKSSSPRVMGQNYRAS